MSNKFDAKEINDQIDKLKPNLEIALADLQGVGNSVTAILNNGEFTGEFATNVKSYYSEVHGKAIEVLHTLIDAVNTAGSKLKQNAQTVDSDGNAKIVTDYLLNEQTRDMQTVQEAYTHHKSAIQAQVSSISDIVGISMPSENVGDATEQAKRELKNIAQKVDDFANQSVVDEITSLLGSFDSLIGYMDGCQTAGGPGKYQAGDLGKQPFYADIDKNLAKTVEVQIKEDIKILPGANPDDIKRWIHDMTLKYGAEFVDKLKDPSLWIGTGASVGTEKLVQKIAEEMVFSGELNSAAGKAVGTRIGKHIAEKGLETATKGTTLAKYGSKIGNGVGFGIGMAFDLYQGKTVGEAVTHNVLTTAVSVGTSYLLTAGVGVLLGATPVGWAAVGIAVVGIGVGILADIAYQNNFCGIKDGCDFVGHKIDEGIKAAGEGLKNVGDSIGGALQSLNPFNWGH